MTKLSNNPAKETTAKTAKTRKAKTGPAKLKWDPTKPVQLTLDEGFKRFDAWKQDLLKSRL